MVSLQSSGFKTEENKIQYGFALGLHYQDLIGRTVSKRNRLSSDITLRNWVLRINDLSITPSFYLAWLHPKGRPKTTA